MVKKQGMTLAVTLGLSLSALGVGLWSTEETVQADNTCSYLFLQYSQGACIRTNGYCPSGDVAVCQSDGSWNCQSGCGADLP
jgi:hypothetical protein